MQVILCLFRKEDLVSLLTGYHGKGSPGRVVNDHLLLLTPQSPTFAAVFVYVVTYHVNTDTKKSCIGHYSTSSLPLSLADPFKYCSFFTRLTQTLYIGVEFREKFEQDCV